MICLMPSDEYNSNTGSFTISIIRGSKRYIVEYTAKGEIIKKIEAK